MCSVIGLVSFDDICERTSLKFWQVYIERCLHTTEFRLLLCVIRVILNLLFVLRVT